MRFNSYLSQLNLFQMIQIYLIITIIVIFSYIHLVQNHKPMVAKDTNQINLEKNIKDIKSKVLVPDFIEVLKDFEEQAKKYPSFRINDFKIDKNSITLNGVSKEKELLEFIIYSENYSNNSKIDSLSFKKSDKDLYLYTLKVKFVKKYIRKINESQKLALHKQLDSFEIKKQKKVKPIKIQAIIDSKVVINDKFYGVGDRYKKYIVQNISRDTIELKKGDTILKVRINEVK